MWLVPTGLHIAVCRFLPDGSFLYAAAEDIACPRAWLEPRGCWKLAALPVEVVRCFDLGSLTGLVQTSASPTWRAAPNFWAISTILCPRGKEKKKKESQGWPAETSLIPGLQQAGGD